MSKHYGLRVRKKEDAMWSDIIAVSPSIQKLRVFMCSPDNTTFVGTPDKHNTPNVVSYTDPKTFPCWQIEEIIYVN